MRTADFQIGLSELRAARRASLGLFWWVGLFSVFTNILILTGPIYMLQVYDRVLISQSLPTLAALTCLAGFLYAMMGLLDHARGRIMIRIGARFQHGMERRVFDAMLRNDLAGRHALKGQRQAGPQQLEAVQRLMTSQAVLALFDLPWVPIFAIGIAMFHPWLGALAFGGGAVLVLLALGNQALTRRSVIGAGSAGAAAMAFGAQIGASVETVQAAGLREHAFARWQAARDKALSMQVHAADVGGSMTVALKTCRLFLQTAMLGLGAWLVIKDEISAGAMIAASILLARGLAPIEQMIGSWPLFTQAHDGWHDLARLLTEMPAPTPGITLPTPAAHLDIQALTVIPPGAAQPVLRMMNLAVRPGQAIGVIGPSGAGKSALARAVSNLWLPATGAIRLDGATLDQYDPVSLGRHIGYLPQRVDLFDGTIAENIARLSPDPKAEQVIAAARKAGAHDMILRLPDGYATRIETAGGRLSGGQIQRIGLARALFENPVLLVLDEPNAHLDHDGAAALNGTIRTMKSEGRSVLIMTHRPAAIEECDLILVIDRGQRVAFGPRHEILRDVLDNPQALRATPSQHIRTWGS
jgi:ATP-binding cassette subfamily C protein